MKDRADIVIVGAGIAGASLAYHLAELGRRDVVVLEQGDLSSGTTSHAPGLVGQLRTSPALARMLMYSVGLYRRLSVDGVPGFLGEGSLRLASSPARFAQLQEQAKLAASIGLEVRLLDRAEALARFPLMSAAGIEGGLLIPSDGSANATVLAQALIQSAQAHGVEFMPHTAVTSVEQTRGRVSAVQTTRGRILTDTLIIAAGIWSPRVGALAGVAIPLTPMQHQYAVTVPLPELAGQALPNLRDPDKLVYFRQRGETLVVGGYERNPRSFAVDAIPNRAEPTVQPFDPVHFGSLHAAAVERVPLLARAGYARQVNGLESFTPDGEFLLGPAAETAGVWVACGFCAHGVSGAGGVGKALAEWLVHGDPGLDLAAMDVRRFAGQALDQRRIQHAASLVYATYYDIPVRPHVV